MKKLFNKLFHHHHHKSNSNNSNGYRYQENIIIPPNIKHIYSPAFNLWRFLMEPDEENGWTLETMTNDERTLIEELIQAIIEQGSIDTLHHVELLDRRSNEYVYFYLYFNGIFERNTHDLSRFELNIKRVSNHPDTAKYQPELVDLWSLNLDYMTRGYIYIHYNTSDYRP